jgi:hypothetical protein
MMSGSNSSETADGATQIHVVPCDEYGPAPGSKRIYPAAVFRRQAVPDIYREEPKLIIFAALKIRQERIRCSERIAVSRRQIEQRLSRRIPFLAQERGEKREPGDRPIICGRRYRRLQEDSVGHAIP